MITKGTPFSLEQYRNEGFSGPVQGLTLEEADRYNQLFFDAIGQSKYEPGPTDEDIRNWHRKRRWSYELATHPSILEPIKQILGNDVILWAMTFWYKEPGNPNFIPWHQDIHYWPMEPAINATAWMSLGWSIRENGCLRVMPGTHNGFIEHGSLQEGQTAYGFKEGLDPSLVDESKVIDLEMTPGQVAFFDETVFHGSEVNQSNIPRVAFSARYTTPAVKFNLEKFSGIMSAMLVSGEDRLHLNDAVMIEPPAK